MENYLCFKDLLKLQIIWEHIRISCVKLKPE